MSGHKFLGFEAIAPWLETLPRGRIVAEESRHATLVFLGDREVELEFPPPRCLPRSPSLREPRNLEYKKVGSYPLLPPFEEIPHTADVAYKIRGENWRELYLHALTAMAFSFPPILQFREKEEFGSLNEVIAALGRAPSQRDAAFGAPLKAVSYQRRGLHEKRNPRKGDNRRCIIARKNSSDKGSDCHPKAAKLRGDRKDAVKKRMQLGFHLSI